MREPAQREWGVRRGQRLGGGEVASRNGGASRGSGRVGREGRSAVYEFLRERGRRWAGCCAKRLIDEEPCSRRTV